MIEAVIRYFLYPFRFLLCVSSLCFLNPHSHFPVCIALHPPSFLELPPLLCCVLCSIAFPSPLLICFCSILYCIHFWPFPDDKISPFHAIGRQQPSEKRIKEENCISVGQIIRRLSRRDSTFISGKYKFILLCKFDKMLYIAGLVGRSGTLHSYQQTVGLAVWAFYCFDFLWMSKQIRLWEYSYRKSETPMGICH